MLRRVVPCSNTPCHSAVPRRTSRRYTARSAPPRAKPCLTSRLPGATAAATSPQQRKKGMQLAAQGTVNKVLGESEPTKGPQQIQLRELPGRGGRSHRAGPLGAGQEEGWPRGQGWPWGPGRVSGGRCAGCGAGTRGRVPESGPRKALAGQSPPAAAMHVGMHCWRSRSVDSGGWRGTAGVLGLEELRLLHRL